MGCREVAFWLGMATCPICTITGEEFAWNAQSQAAWRQHCRPSALLARYTIATVSPYIVQISEEGHAANILLK